LQSSEEGAKGVQFAVKFKQGEGKKKQQRQGNMNNAAKTHGGHAEDTGSGRENDRWERDERRRRTREKGGGGGKREIKKDKKERKKAEEKGERELSLSLSLGQLSPSPSPSPLLARRNHSRKPGTKNEEEEERRRRYRQDHDAERGREGAKRRECTFTGRGWKTNDDAMQCIEGMMEDSKETQKQKGERRRGSCPH